MASNFPNNELNNERNDNKEDTKTVKKCLNTFLSRKLDFLVIEDIAKSLKDNNNNKKNLKVFEIS